MITIHCSLDYHRSSNSKVSTFALGVRDGQFINSSVFTSPPVTKTVFEGHIEDYENTYSAYKNGGSAQKGPFLTAKEVLMGDLDQFAISTDGIAKGDPDIILLGGFVPTKGTASDGHVPGQPKATLKRGEATGVLLAESDVVDGAESYGCLLSLAPLVNTHIDATGQLTMGAGEVIARMDLTKGRKKEFVGCTPGETYYIYFFAANATGVSQLSEVRRIMCA